VDIAIAGIVLVNPAYRLTYSAGLAPTFCDYVAFAANSVFRPAALTVDMNSRPEAVQDADDREEALAMQRDPLVVRYFSMRTMSAWGAVMGRCVVNAMRSNAPLLLVEGARDAMVDPKGSAEIFDAAAAADKERLSSPGGHGSSAIEAVVTPLLEWLTRHSERSTPTTPG
jgi:alpha-beta hydrolase superfamily lysophospholipase